MADFRKPKHDDGPVKRRREAIAGLSVREVAK